MKNCDTCSNFIKVLTFKDGRKGICNHKIWTISNLKLRWCKGNCKYYKSKKYKIKKVFITYY